MVGLVGMVSSFSFSSDEPGSNPAEVNSFLLPEMNKNKQKEAWVGLRRLM